LRKRRKKMEVKLGEAPSSKEENEVEAVQLVGLLRRCSGEVEGIQWWRRG
jgi:hypothetical protein